ncbi:MAG: DUF445 domain-containing protein [Deltaproteobacteria bacterium]|nr:DUF445 domain-containing protein [Deltaproteobacteria bacterium]
MTKDDIKRAALKKRKWLATGLLFFVAVVYFISKKLERPYPWLGFLTAFAEAAMVGALADWFAVTALFRHPLGIPRRIALRIPLFRHTAIIPENKDRIGEGLGDFVERHFLTPEAIIEKLQQEDIAKRSAEWLADPVNSSLIADELCSFLPKVLEAIDDKDVRKFITGNINSAVKSIDLAPLAGQFLSVVTSGNKHQVLFDEGIKLIRNVFEDYKPQIQRKIADETWWIFKLVNGDVKLYNKVVAIIERTLIQIADDPQHELRTKFNEAAKVFIEKLKTSPDFKAKGEAFKEEFLKHPAAQKYFDNVWEDLKGAILRDVARPGSAVRARIKEALMTIGAGLSKDQAVRAKLNVWIQNALVNTISSHRNAISGLIASRVKKWDARTITEMLELQVGEDLQFIRINGTIVGGFVGLLIYFVSLLFS